jgi:transcription elongation factor GreA
LEKELLTPNGYEKLTKEIRNLTLVERPKIIEEVQIAREHGDLKENAEYHAAKEKQRLIDKKIGELNHLLINSQIVEPEKLDHSRVGFGSTVTLVDLDTDEELKYTIVGSFEANSDKNIISYNSPFAKKLMGKHVGEEFEIRIGSEDKEFEILKIEFVEIDFES